MLSIQVMPPSIGMRYFHLASSRASSSPVVSQVWPIEAPACLKTLVASVALFQNAAMFCLLLDHEAGAGVPHAARILFGLVDVEHAVGLELADRVEIEADAHDHRLLAEGRLAVRFRHPERAVGHLVVREIEYRTVEGDRFRAPVEGEQHAIAAIGAAERHRVAQHGLDQIVEVRAWPRRAAAAGCPGSSCCRW